TPVEIAVVDVADADELGPRQVEHARRPFDLARDLMLRATVFRLGPERHVVLLQVHHIAVDGWSVDVLYAEISELSDAARGVRAHEASPYIVLLAAFGTLLYRAGGSDEILVGTPSANRGAAEFEPLIGYFNNTLVMRLRLNGNPTFAQLLERVRTTVLDASD